MWESVLGILGGLLPLLYVFGRVFCFATILFGAFVFLTIGCSLAGSGASFPSAVSVGWTKTAGTWRTTWHFGRFRRCLPS